MEWAQLATLITLIASVASGAWWLSRKFQRLEQRLERLEIRVGLLEHRTRGIQAAIRSLVTAVASGQHIGLEQAVELIRRTLDTPSMGELLSQLSPTGNPLTKEDVQRLRAYVERLKRGETLTLQEAQDFYRLADEVTRAYPEQEGSWLLLVAAGFLLGVLLGASRK